MNPARTVFCVRSVSHHKSSTASLSTFRCVFHLICQSNISNSILAKVGRLASEEVVIQLLKYKCLQILLYVLEVCNLDKRSLQSLDFVVHVNGLCMKLFKTSSLEIIQYCRTSFGLQLLNVLIRNRYEKFIADLSRSCVIIKFFIQFFSFIYTCIYLLIGTGVANKMNIVQKLQAYTIVNLCLVASCLVYYW